MKATFELEAIELELHGGPVAGVDEAGRGPLAGPVVAAAVVLDPATFRTASPTPRRSMSMSAGAIYQAHPGGGPRRHRRCRRRLRIDTDNILNAALWAMAQAVARLDCAPKLVLIDGNKAPPLDCPTRTIVQGDAKCLSIAAASIVAKVARDAMMAELARRYPNYGFDRHKGYGTPEHHAAIARYGVTPHHRRSFRPVQLALGLL